MSQTKTKACEKKLKAAELRLLKILNKIDNFKLNDSYTSQLCVPGNEQKSNLGRGLTNLQRYRFTKHRILVAALIVFLSAFYWTYLQLSTKRCIVELPSISKAIFRPPEDCDQCADVTGAARVANISSREFEDKYAYGAHPIIVTDAASDWPAIKEFNFEFFKSFYQNAKMGIRINDCFYFAYKSGLNSLEEVFSMDEARANLSGEPWYVGWSTCFDEETRNLRTYYNRPYFLPATAESDMVDWIFMGGPGQGAHMHVDSVKHMSWQAQIRGRKRWELAPPPECLYVCSWLTFTVAPGEILVVDTNRWYHRTQVLPGDISITIGAEYD